MLEFDATEQPQGPITLEESPGTHSPDDDPAGIERSLSVAISGDVGRVEVSVDITHSWIGDLRISLRSPAGTDIILHDRSGRDTDDIVRTYTVSNTPGLGELPGEPISGDWQLHISDHTSQDLGKLNAWRIVIHPGF